MRRSPPPPIQVKQKTSFCFVPQFARPFLAQKRSRLPISKQKAIGALVFRIYSYLRRPKHEGYTFLFDWFPRHDSPRNIDTSCLRTPLPLSLPTRKGKAFFANPLICDRHRNPHYKVRNHFASNPRPYRIRMKDEPEKPLVTVEYSLKDKKVLQCYGDHDSKPNDNVMEFVNKKWLPYANRKLKQIAA